MQQIGLELPSPAPVPGALTAEQRRAIRLAQAGEWGLADAMELDWLNGPTSTVEPIFSAGQDDYLPFDEALLGMVRAAGIRRTDAGLVVVWVGTWGWAELRRCRHDADPAGQSACRHCRGTGYRAVGPAAGADGPSPAAEMVVLETDIDGRILAVLGVG